HDVDDLEGALLAGAHRLLPGDHNQGHASELRESGGRDQVGGSGPEGAEAYPGPSGEPAAGGGHEPRRLLVAGHDQVDGRRAERLEEIEVLFAGNGEDAVHALGLEAADEEVG